MPSAPHALRPRLVVLLVSLCCATATTLAADTPAPIPRSQTLTVNLIRRLVQRGVLPQADADDLMKLAEEDTAAARAEAVASTPVAASAKTDSATAAPTSSDTVRVTYVPEFVKRQIRDEVKQEVMAQARAERWAAPRTLPEWVTRYTLFGDFRLRQEGIYYPSGNDNTGAFPNFNAINTGSPFDVTGTVFSPQNNVDQTRNRTRIRARFGADIDMGDGFASGARIATGENNSPVTTNQSLGATGGNFSKYALWLDRAFMRFQAGGERHDDWTLSVGRFDNPFFTTSQLIFDDDLGFDGLAAQGKLHFGETLKPFVTIGAFPVFNSALNFSTIQPSKFKSQDRWLYAAQIGTSANLASDMSAKIGAAYYYYDNIAGKLSSPFTPVTAQDNGDTDETRPGFAQNGNTYFPLRNIVPGVLNNFGTINQFQYFGLATPYREFAVTGRIDYNHFEPFQISLGSEFVTNLAFHRGSIRKKAINNLGPKGVGDFAGGADGWNVDVKLGAAALTKRWDWNASLGYRHLESDAVVDGFTDSDFGNGGTNLKGFTVGGALALSPRVWLGLRWLSASSIAGPIYKNDIFQFDFNGKF